MSKSFKTFMIDHSAAKAKILIEQNEEKKLEKRMNKHLVIIEELVEEEVVDIDIDEETRNKYIK